MAENLRALSTAKNVTEDILTDVAQAVGQKNQTRTYGATGQMSRTTGGRGHRRQPRGMIGRICRNLRPLR
jgi:hypothetical protein